MLLVILLVTLAQTYLSKGKKETVLMKRYPFALAATLSVMSLSSAQTIFAEETTETTPKNIETTGTITFTPAEGPSVVVPPVEEPDVNPPEIPDKTAGPLAIVHAPTLNFGKQEISVEDKTYEMQAERATTMENEEQATTKGGDIVPYVSFVQVQDLRGTNAGWNLKVSLSAFKSTGTQNDTLEGAELTFAGGAINYSGGEASEPKLAYKEKLEIEPGEGSSYVMTAKSANVEKEQIGEGAGVTSLIWGNQEDLNSSYNKTNDLDKVVNKSITLFVPGNTTKDAATYTATLTWELTNTPPNDIE